MLLHSLITLSNLLILLVYAQDFGDTSIPSEYGPGFPLLKDLSNEEVCDAICYVPTNSVLYYFYEADMMVLRQILRGLVFQKHCLLKNLEPDCSCASTQSIRTLQMLVAAFSDLNYAYQGVDSEFLIRFDSVARAHGLESPISLKCRIVALAKDVTELGKECIGRFREELSVSLENSRNCASTQETVLTSAVDPVPRPISVC
ncbi:hypothetical protein OXX79_003624 [Metschnikowia pulcherrima]